MTAFVTKSLLNSSSSSSSCLGLQSSNSSLTKLGFLHIKKFDQKVKDLGVSVFNVKSKNFPVIKAIEESKTTAYVETVKESGLKSQNGFPCNGNSDVVVSNVGQSTNIVWHECSVGRHDREKLLQQKGCVIWITGLSGSGKSTLACALTRGLHCRGKLTYILDGDNVRHGLNRDLSFKAEDRAENIRRVGEVAKLFADAGVICIASLISPYRRDRDACRALLPDGNFVEVFMDASLQLCEARDSKGLYKLARAGKIKGFTGIDDPYEPPLNSEIAIRVKDGDCSSPADMAKQVIAYLEENGYMQG
ncbi:Adenylyl-sulfate kinase, partial [Thalictrum thalictroides]